jgi:hypothetical protein
MAWRQMLQSKRNIKFFTLLYIGQKPFKDHCIFCLEKKSRCTEFAFISEVNALNGVPGSQ